MYSYWTSYLATQNVTFKMLHCLKNCLFSAFKVIFTPPQCFVKSHARSRWSIECLHTICLVILHAFPNICWRISSLIAGYAACVKISVRHFFEWPPQRMLYHTIFSSGAFFTSQLFASKRHFHQMTKQEVMHMGERGSKHQWKVNLVPHHVVLFRISSKS